MASLRSYKPMIVPSQPTSVSLQSYSGTSLLITFSAPLDNGGDANVTYRSVHRLCGDRLCADVGLLSDSLRFPRCVVWGWELSLPFNFARVVEI